MKTLFLTILILAFSSVTIANFYGYDKSERYKEYYRAFIAWENVYTSIAAVESSFDTYAVSHRGAGGVIQIMPENAGGYLDEANRLLGFKKFKDRDRFSPQKSREIWEVVMKFRNPEKSLLRAIKLHNPNAGKWYAERVTKKYEEFTKKINKL